MHIRSFVRLAGLLLALAFVTLLALSCGDSREVILATTTSTQDSGLLDVLVPAFEKETGYSVKTIAVGSGQALRLGEQGEADVILAHSPQAEEDFVAAGHGIERQPVMHNDFVIVGPRDDPAGIAGLSSAADALKRIAQSGAVFLSRGDQSGTNAKELALWTKAGVQPSGGWYQETGQGMGATLTIADEKRGYTLSDRGTYLAQRHNLHLSILVQGDHGLFNIYHVMIVNPEKHSQVNADGARAFANFITAAQTQELIRGFGLDQFGEPLFEPDAYVKSTPPPGN